MTDILFSVLSFTLIMSAIIFLLLLLNRFFGEKFMSRTRYIIWGIVIIRLCLPFIGAFSPKLINFVYTLPSEKTTVESEFSSTEEYIDHTFDSQESFIGAIDSEAHMGTVQGGSGADDTVNDQMAQSSTTDPDRNETVYRSVIKKSSFDFYDLQLLITILLCSGAIIFFLSKLIPYFLYRKRLEGFLLLPDENILDVYFDLCERLKIRRTPDLFVCEEIPGPMLCGFFKRAIILPERNFERRDLENVLTHELVHHKRGDLWLKLIAVIANAINFFNPLVYIAVSKLEKEIELSCDEEVLRNVDSEGRLAYGAFMLEIIRKRMISAPPLTSFYSPRQSTVKERFLNILNDSTRKHGKAIIITVLALCLAAGSILGCEAIKKLSSKNLFIKGDVISLSSQSVEFPEISFQRKLNATLKRYTPNDTSVSAFLEANDLFIACEQQFEDGEAYFELFYEDRESLSCIYSGTTSSLEFYGADFSRLFGKKGFYFEYDNKKIFFADVEGGIPYPYYKTSGNIIGPIDIDSDGECELVMNGELYTTLSGKSVRFNINDTVAKHYALSSADLSMVFPYSSYYYVYGLSYDGDVQSDGSYTQYTAKLTYSGGTLTVEPAGEKYVNNNKEYKTDNRGWELYYSMKFNALVLESKDSCFGYNPNLENISKDFSGIRHTCPSFGTSYFAYIFEEQERAAIVIKGEDSIRVSFIDLSSGKISDSVSHNSGEMLSLHGVSKFVLAKYRKTNFGNVDFPQNFDRFIMDATVREGKESIIAEFYLKTFDEKITLKGSHTLRSTSSSMGKYKATKTDVFVSEGNDLITSLEYSFKPENFDIKVYDFKTSPTFITIYTSDLEGNYYLQSQFDQLPDEDYVYSEVINFGECENGTLLFALVDANYYDKEEQIYTRRYFVYIANPESMYDDEGLPSSPLRWIYKYEIDINSPTSREWTQNSYSGGRFTEQTLSN